MVEIIGIAHAAIFTHHRGLIDSGQDDDHTRALLDESIEIVFREAPGATAQARSLAALWAEQQLLDPGRVETTWSLLVAELEDTERSLERLLARQEEIAAELHRTAEPSDR